MSFNCKIQTITILFPKIIQQFKFEPIFIGIYTQIKYNKNSQHKISKNKINRNSKDKPQKKKKIIENKQTDTK